MFRLSTWSVLLPLTMLAAAISSAWFMVDGYPIWSGTCGAAALGAALIYLNCVYRFIHKIEREVDEIAHNSGVQGKKLNKHTVVGRLDALMENMKDALEHEYIAKALKRQAELDALQSQINPHFLYNTLDSIRGQALVEEVDEIADMAEALSTFFRYSISNKGNMVRVSDELDNVQNYLTIQHYRFGDRIRMEMDIADQSLLDCRIPKMTLQPIVENAVYHGLESVLRKGVIQISICSVDERLQISIRDNGVGMGDDTLRELNKKLSGQFGPENLVCGERGNHSGIALVNVCQRLRLLYGEQYGIHVYSTLHVGSETVIELPLLPDMGTQEEMV